MTVYGEKFDIFGNAPPAWLTDDMTWEWSVDNGATWSAGLVTIKGYANAGAWHAIDCIRVVQPSPADTVTVRVMSEMEARHYFLGRTEGTNQDRFVQLLRELGLIRPDTKAESIAKSTNLPLADVERVLAAVEDGE